MFWTLELSYNYFSVSSVLILLLWQGYGFSFGSSAVSGCNTNILRIWLLGHDCRAPSTHLVSSLFAFFFKDKIRDEKRKNCINPVENSWVCVIAPKKKIL